MRAYSTASGAAMFVPDELPRKKPRSISYSELVEEEKPKSAPPMIWNWIKRKTRTLSKAA